MALTNKLTAIGDAIRTKTETTDLIPLADMPNKITDVYDAGKQAEYDAFWDLVQENGNRTNYDFCFAGEAWSVDNFKPKYHIQPTSCQNMFAYWGTYSGRRGTVDLRGFSIDFSKSTLVANCFYGNFFVVAVGEINTTSVIHLQSFFSTCPNLHTIEKLVIKESGENTYYNTFYYCINLKNITFEGVIGNDISFQDSPLLTLDSLKSIINALKDYSGTDKEYTCKLTLSSASKTLLENEGATAPNGLTWLEYIGALGWNA